MRIVADPHALYFGAELDDSTLMPGAECAAENERVWEWLRNMITAG